MSTRDDGLMLRSTLLARGFGANEVRHLRDAERLESVRPGAYVDGDDERLRLPETRHLLAVRAAIAQLRPGGVVSHVSAALLLGIAVWDVPLGRVHLTRPGVSGGRRSRHLQVHVAALGPDEVRHLGGMMVTSPARTVADLVRSLPFEQAVVIADDALHRKLITVGDLAAAVGRTPRRHGTASARRVLDFADGRAESPGESRSRVRIHDAGLPVPDLQVPVRAADGRPLGRTDFGWKAQRVVAEFDGRIKYGRLLRTGEGPGDAVFAEKVREDAIRDTGLRVVRWTWSELEPFTEVAARLARALGSAR